MIKITETIARKVLEVVDAGLSNDVGAAVPGHMCVEAAVCFALGEPHGDKPSCVAPALRAFKIGLNDAGWSSNEARAKGLRRLALVQLGSAGVLDEIEFAKRLALVTVNKTIPRVLRLAAAMKLPAEHSKAMENAATACEAATDLDAAARAASDASYAASDAARAASYAASYAASAASDARAASYAARAASDKELSETAETVVQVLVGMNAPGAQWLGLAPLAA